MRRTDSVGLATIVEYGRDLIARAAAIPHERLVRREFPLPGLMLDVYGVDQAYVDLCATRLARVEVPAGGAGRSVRIFALDAATLGWEAPARWRDRDFSPVDLNSVMAGAGLRAAHSLDRAAWQFFEVGTATGVQYLADPLAYPPWDPAAPLRAFLHWSYGGATARVTHAGTLALDGTGILLAGPGGSGKSATTLAGVLSGLGTVGDDFVVIDLKAEPVAYPLFVTLKLDPSGVTRLDALAARLPEGQTNWQGKIEYDATRIGDGRMRDRMEISAILLPRIAGDGPTTIAAASGGDAMRALMPSSLFQIPEDYHQGFRFFGELARRVPAFHVQLSRDPTEIAAKIADFIRNGTRLR